MNPMRQTMSVVLKDQLGGDRTVKVTVEATAQGVCIKPKGYGEQAAADGYGSPIVIEIADGKLQVHIWTDINAADSQTISLEGARESARLTP